MTIDAKQKAAIASADYNQLAAIYAGAAAICMTVEPEAGMILGLASALAWAQANEYASLAADPPRSDFHVVTKVGRSNLFRSAPLNPRREWSAFQLVGGHVSVAIDAFVTSLERLDGARLALRSGDADPGLIAGYISKQRRAISHNATMANSGIRMLRKMRFPVNVAWLSMLREIGVSPGTQIPQGEQSDAIALWELIQEEATNLLPDARSLDSIKQHILESYQHSLVVPFELLDEHWDRTMNALVQQLDTFASKPGAPRRIYELT